MLEASIDRLEKMSPSKTKKWNFSWNTPAYEGRASHLITNTVAPDTAHQPRYLGLVARDVPHVHDDGSGSIRLEPWYTNSMIFRPSEVGFMGIRKPCNTFLIPWLAKLQMPP